ncbi:MAG TPA: hypothetical protein VHJ38_13415 [Nitrososphaeraceae archaeon]|nr:hypothetical protein [Nitrososphaeraceae archaeon]
MFINSNNAIPVLLVLTGGTSFIPVRGVKYLLFSDNASIERQER